jgi:hypothetical protein
LGAVDAVNGNSIANTGGEWIEITNGSGGSLTVTFTTSFQYQGYDVADLPVTIANGREQASAAPSTPRSSAQRSTSTGRQRTSVTARVMKLSATKF